MDTNNSTSSSGLSAHAVFKVLSSLMGTPFAAVGIIVLVCVVATAIFAPVLAPVDPTEQDLDARFTPPMWTEGGQREHPLGTDHLGRDMLSRMIYGSRASLMVALASVVGSGLIGTTVGLIAGYSGGWIDEVLGRLMDVQLAIPYLLLAIVIVMILGAGLYNTILVLVIAGWVGYARLVRGAVLSLRTREFVEAARSLGQRDFVIVIRHLLPNCLNPVIVMATLEMANMMLFEAGLSFLGLGVRPPAISWGSMLADGRDYVVHAWWVATFPGAIIFLTLFGINQVGDWLRDLLDPRSLTGRN